MLKIGSNVSLFSLVAAISATVPASVAALST